MVQKNVRYTSHETSFKAVAFRKRFLTIQASKLTCHSETHGRQCKNKYTKKYISIVDFKKNKIEGVYGQPGSRITAVRRQCADVFYIALLKLHKRLHAAPAS